MNPQYEQFNERLEQSIEENTPGVGDASSRPRLGETESADLLDLARQLRAASHLRVDPSFAAQLERRVLRHALTRSQSAAGARAPGRFRSQRRMLMLAASLFLALVLLGAGLLALAARTTNPASPFYSLGHYGQPSAQSTPTLSPANLAAADLQTARLRLLSLQNVANLAQTNAYVQGLASFDAQLARATTSISALPAGDEKTSLSTQLAQIKGEARQKLHGWLHALTPAASAATTSELGRLGESIPRVSGASIVLPAHPRGSATVRVMGSGLQPGAQLLVDGKPVSVTGTLQNNQLVFVLPWNSEKHPHTLGIINLDGTVAQTDNVTVSTTSTGTNGDGNGQGK